MAAATVVAAAACFAVDFLANIECLFIVSCCLLPSFFVAFCLIFATATLAIPITVAVASVVPVAAVAVAVAVAVSMAYVSI